MKLGQLLMTKGVAEGIKKSQQFELDVGTSFLRYLIYDWGDLCPEDIELNIDALKKSLRVLGAYETCLGKIYIITEWDRSVTTILFADEY